MDKLSRRGLLTGAGAVVAAGPLGVPAASARTLSLPLSFLGSGTYTATVYADGTPGTSAYQTPVVVSTRTVTSATTLSVAMAPSGGQAVVLRPS